MVFSGQTIHPMIVIFIINFRYNLAPDGACKYNQILSSYTKTVKGFINDFYF